MTSKELTDTLLSVIRNIIENTGIREKEIIAIRMHPSIFLQLNKEVADWLGFTELQSIQHPTFAGIPIIMDPDIWLSFESRPRIGWP